MLIEYKGFWDRLEKLDANGLVDNKDDKDGPAYGNIKDYAVNGAVHYAGALLHYTGYSDVIAIGVSGDRTRRQAAHAPRRLPKRFGREPRSLQLRG